MGTSEVDVEVHLKRHKTYVELFNGQLLVGWLVGLEICEHESWFQLSKIHYQKQVRTFEYKITISILISCLYWNEKDFAAAPLTEELLKCH